VKSTSYEAQYVVSSILPLTSKYVPQHLFSNHPGSLFSVRTLYKPVTRFVCVYLHTSLRTVNSKC